jgi:hypothetical protein
MPEYRFYMLGADGLISQPAVLAKCRDDGEAIERAKRLLDDAAMEVWQAARRVIRLESGRK